MTDYERANKAKDLLEKAKDLLSDLDAETDPFVSSIQDAIQSVIDDIDIELVFDSDGALEEFAREDQEFEEDDEDEGDEGDEDDDY